MGRRVDPKVKAEWQRWLTRKRAELMLKTGKSISVTDFAAWLGESRQNVDYWLNDGGMPDAGSVLNIYNTTGDITLFDVLQIPRPAAVPSLVSAVVTPYALNEFKRNHPEEFERLRQQMEAAAANGNGAKQGRAAGSATAY